MELLKLMDNIAYKGAIKNINIKNISYDSRKISKDSLFIAIKGEKYDGHNFIKDAIKNGASTVIVDRILSKEYKTPILRVKNSRYTMSKLADIFFNHPSSRMNTIGITGTNGKTTTAYIVDRIFNQNNLKTGSIGTLGFVANSNIRDTGHTTPESVELHSFLDELYKMKIPNVVMEISSHSLALDRVAHVSVDTAIYTNLSSEHLDFHSDLESYFKEKLKLFSLLKTNGNAVINIDDYYSKEILETIKSNVITYGFKKNADIHPVSYNCDYHKMAFVLSIFNEKYDIETNITGKYNIYNIMASIAVCLLNEIEIQDVINSIKNIKAIPGRLEFIGNEEKKIFIDYAHTPDAFQNVLSLMDSIKKKNHKIITLFGCGGDRDKSKRFKMAEIAEYYSDIILVTSDNPRTEKLEDIINDISSGFSSSKHLIIKNREEAIKYAIKHMDQDTILLILGKGREDYEIVGDIKHNHNDIKIIERELHES